MDHQSKGIQFLYQSSRNILLADEMGTGKTILSLTYGLSLIHAGKIDRVLAVVPAALQLDWCEEIFKVYQQYPSQVGKDMREDTWVTLSSYSMLRQKANGMYYHVNRLLQQFNNLRVMIILDEAHTIKNVEGVTRNLINCFNAEYKLPMTGTPIWNKPEDLYALLHFCDPTLDEAWFFNTFTKRRLRRIYGKRKAYVITGYKNHEQLHHFVNERMLRRLRSECLDLPRKIVKYVPCEGISDTYDSVLSYIDLNDDTVLVKLIALQQAASGLNPYDGRFKPNAKLKLLLELLSTMDGRILLYFKFTSTLYHVQEYLRKEGHETYIFTGDNQSSRHQQAEMWKRSDKGILMGTIRAAGVGLTLVESSTAIFYESELSPSANAQAEDRIYRKGQTQTCCIFYLYGQRTVEEAISKINKSKSRQNAAIIEGDKLSAGEEKQLLQFTVNMRYQ